MEMQVVKRNGNHLPILMKLMSITDGDILEIGTGAFSTPYLHWACSLTGRKLVSVENNDEYFTFAKEFETDFHKVVKEIEAVGKWDIVFIDSFPLEDREKYLKQFVNYAKYLVVHDTLFEQYKNVTKYYFEYVKDDPFTSIFSNFISLDNFNI